MSVGWKRHELEVVIPRLGEICSARDSSFYGVLRRGCHSDEPGGIRRNRKIK